MTTVFGAGPSRSPVRLALLGILVVAAIGAGGAWYVFLRPSGPPPVLDAATDHPASSAPGGPTSSLAAGDPSDLPAGLSGSWSVDPSIGSFSDFSGSFVGYRVQEQLVNVGGNTAVGRTPAVTGSLTLEGTTVSAATFSAQLAGLESDDSRRDGRVQESLSVRQFPAATFVLATPVDLGSLPRDGQDLQVSAAGRLTIRGVTRDVEFPLTATLNGTVLTVRGALEIRFSDFEIPKPSSFLVLSIADSGTIEVQLQLTRTA